MQHGARHNTYTLHLQVAPVCRTLNLHTLSQVQALEDSQSVKLAHDRLPYVQVDFFDASGTLFSMANFINNFIPGTQKDLPSGVWSVHCWGAALDCIAQSSHR